MFKKTHTSYLTHHRMFACAQPPLRPLEPVDSALGVIHDKRVVTSYLNNLNGKIEK